MNIALLEDNVAITDYLTVSLQQKGHTVYSFPNGISLLKTLFIGSRPANPLPYDLIISDLFLTDGRSSLDVLSYIMQHIPLETLPIIVIAAASASASEIEYMQRKFPQLPILRNPFDAKALLKLLKKR